MLTIQEIKKFIDSDATSEKKKFAKVGLKYYEAQHDIKNYRIFFIDADGKPQEDKTKSNIKISHPFFTELVDQCTQYMLSGDGFVKSDNTELQEYLDTYFNDNEDFTAELYEVLTGTQAKGFDYVYAYKSAEDRTAFQWADSIGVVEVRAKETSDNRDYIIYHYIDRITKDNKQIKRIQVWDDKQVTYFCQIGNEDIKLDDSVKINPKPHIIWNEDGDDSTHFAGYGFIPFFRLDNCKKQISALKPIKDLIDDYDLMSCGLSNNIQDTNEALYVVKGFEGDDLDEMMVNVKAKKHIGLSGEGSGLDIKTVDIPYQARQAKLDLDEKNIYRFGFGLNIAGLKDTSATTNIAIKSAYSLLDLRANKLKIHLKQFMRKLLKVVLKEINDAEGTDYQMKDVYFDFEWKIPTNAHENAQIELIETQRKQAEITTLQNLANTLDDETIIKLICEQLDINYEDIKAKLPSPEEDLTAQAKATLAGIVPEGDVIG